MAGGGGGSGEIGPLNPRGLEMRKVNGDPYYMRIIGNGWLDCKNLDENIYGQYGLIVEQIPIVEIDEEDTLPYARFAISIVTPGDDAYFTDSNMGYYANSNFLANSGQVACVYYPSTDEWKFYSGDAWSTIQGLPNAITLLKNDGTDWLLLRVMDTAIPAVIPYGDGGFDAFDKAVIDYCQDEKYNHIVYVQNYTVTNNGELVVTRGSNVKFIGGDPEDRDITYEAIVRYNDSDVLDHPSQSEVIADSYVHFMFVGDHEDPLAYFWNYTQEEIESYTRRQHHGWYKWEEGVEHYWENAYYEADIDKSEFGKSIEIYSDPSDTDMVALREPEGTIDPEEITGISNITRICAYGSYIVLLDPEAEHKIKVLWWQRPPDAFDWELAYMWGEARTFSNPEDPEIESFEDPQSIACDGKYIYILDKWTNPEYNEEYYVKKYSISGTYINRQQLPKKGKDICLLR